MPEVAPATNVGRSAICQKPTAEGRLDRISRFVANRFSKTNSQNTRQSGGRLIAGKVCVTFVVWVTLRAAGIQSFMEAETGRAP